MEAQCDLASFQDRRPLIFGVMLLQSVEAVHSRIALCISPQLHQCQGGFRWGETCCTCGRPPTLSLRSWLFNILVDGLARAVHDVCPGVSLMASWDSRFAGQLYADDLVIVADSAADLQTGSDAVSAWRFRYRFRFGIGPSKSAAMIFWSPEKHPCVQCDIGKCCPPCGHRVQVFWSGALSRTVLGRSRPARDGPKQPIICTLRVLMPC